MSKDKPSISTQAGDNEPVPLKQGDLTRLAGEFREEVKTAGRPSVVVNLEPGHNVSNFLSSDENRKDLSYAEIDVIARRVYATNGRIGISVPMCKQDVIESKGTGKAYFDFRQAKTVLAPRKKDEEAMITLTQSFEHCEIKRCSSLKGDETTQTVQAEPLSKKIAWPDVEKIIREYETRPGNRVVVSAAYLHKVADYIMKNSEDGTMLLDIGPDHKEALYIESRIIEAGVAKIVVMPVGVENVFDPYQRDKDATQFSGGDKE